MLVGVIMTPLQTLSLKDRIEFYAIKRAECSAAIRGQKVPLALGMEVTQACVVRGIRYHHGFASELHGTLPVFTRALNARSIMSNIVPNIVGPDEVPYCIWHPQVASESTYRLLAVKYPEMRYQIGRACAVGGYSELYRSLNLLPEVSIAEEALANEQNPGARIIYDDIMANAVKYAIMDDYTRSVNSSNPVPGGFLNADTAVRSTLEEKHVFQGWDMYTTPDCRHYKPHDLKMPYFNITEDYGVTDEGMSQPKRPEDLAAASKALDARSRLLYTPLPQHLPTVNKDLLILRAAYSGNIERYVRLRRRNMIDGEICCIVRGIYHDTMFAKWWSAQPPREGDHSWDRLRIRRAINARFIMNNDLSRIHDSTPSSDLPYLIYYPNFATRETYQELLRRKPCMKPQIARTYLILNEQELWDELAPEPDPFLYWEATSSPNDYFVEYLEQRDPDIGLRDVSDLGSW